MRALARTGVRPARVRCPFGQLHRLTQFRPFRDYLPQHDHRLLLPTPAATVPNGPDWLHEVKYDGYRLRVERDGDLRSIHRYVPSFLNLQYFTTTYGEGSRRLGGPKGNRRGKECES